MSLGSSFQPMECIQFTITFDQQALDLLPDSDEILLMNSQLDICVGKLLRETTFLPPFDQHFDQAFSSLSNPFTSADVFANGSQVYPFQITGGVKPKLANEHDASVSFKQSSFSKTTSRGKPAKVVKKGACSSVMMSDFSKIGKAEPVCEVVYRCPDPNCSYTATNKTCINSHMRYVHTNIKPFSCTMCDYACKTRSDLVKHYRGKHSMPHEAAYQLTRP